MGVDTFDASTKEHFQLKASIFSTISDFPGYANLSGWSTKGKSACPVCRFETNSRWLSEGKSGVICVIEDGFQLIIIGVKTLDPLLKKQR